MTTPSVRTLRQWFAPEGAAITSMDFVRGVDHDWLAVADQGGGLHLIEVSSDKEWTLSPRMEAYGLAYVPRRTHSPGLAAVGQQILAFDLSGEKKWLFPPAELPGHATALAVTALVDDELTVIAVGGKDRDRTADVYLYRGDTGELLGHLEDEDNGAVRAIEALRLERYLVVAHDRGISTWNISHCADQEPHRLRTFGRGDTRAMSVFYDPQGRPRVATASTHGIEIWDPVLESAKHPLSGFARGLNATAIAAVASERPDPQLAVAHDRSVSLWSTTTEELEGELPEEHKGQVSCLATPTGAGSTFLAAADDRGQVVVWELPRVQPTTRQYGRHDRWVNALVAVSAGGFASASDDGTVRLWQPQPGHADLILQRSSRAAVQGLAVLQERHKPDLLISGDKPDLLISGDKPDLLISGDKPDLLISGDEPGHLASWTVPAGNADKHENIGTAVRALATIHDHDGHGYVVAAGAAGRAAGAARLTVWDINARSSGSPIRFGYPAEPTLIRALAVGETDRGELLAAGDSDGRVTVWQTSTPEHLWTNADRHRGQVRTLAWVPTVEGVRLASGGSDGNIYLWPLRPPPDGGNPQRFEGHRGPVAALAALSTADHQVPTPKGEAHLFISGGADGTIRTWNPDTPGDHRPILQAHPGWVRSLLRLEYGGTLYVVSGGDDGTVRQWVVVEGRPQSTRHVGRLPGFGDRPARADLLDRGKFQDVLVSLLRLTPDPPPPPRHLATQPAAHESDTHKDVRATGPRVVAVQGPWGAGKTSLMRLIYKELDEDDHMSPAKGWRTDPTGPERDQQPQPSGNQTPDTSSQPGPSRSARGAGKTSLMRFIYQLREDDPTTFTAREAARRARDGPTRQSSPDQFLPSKILPVWFNPWAHKSAEEVWAGLTQQIIDAARQVIGKTDAEWQRYWFTRNLERLDGGEVRRVLRRRMYWQPLLSSPLSAPGIAAAVAIGVKWPATIPYIAAAGFVVALIAMTATWRRGPARAYLPADIMEGPVLSGFQANPAPFAPASSADDLLLHDPLYHARSGYLYLAQRDVDDLADELARRGYMLVVFVDDLDRCPPEAVAEVFEAVNIFLAENFANAKFVIGLDPSVVAHDLAEVFHAQESRQRDDPDDPNLGWSFLRKLCQLPVTMPAIREAHAARLMRNEQPSGPSASRPSSNPATIMASGSSPGGAGQAGTSRDDIVPEAPESPGGQPVADDAPAEPETLLFEADPVIRDHLRALMRLRPHQSVRETKRLLTLWEFYLRLLHELLPEDRTSSAQFGQDVLTLAEVLTRWPALVPKLGPASSPESGLRELIETARSNTDPAQTSPWQETLGRLGLDGNEFHSSCENLCELLKLYGNDDVSYYAECVL